MKNYSLNHKNQIINEITRKGFCVSQRCLS